jgi:glutamate racemase
MAIIGLFDSGFGGLTVARQIRKQIPKISIEYYGDNGRNPYGPLSQKTIIKYSRQILDFLAKKGPDIVIIACNTATAAALNTIKNEYNFPVLGIIEPGSRAALRESKNKRIGVLGTKFTIDSGAYNKIIKGFNEEVEVFGQACPEFTLLVEQGNIEGKEVEKAASKYLSNLKDTGIDTLILGCTHYPVLIGIIKKYIDKDVKVIDPSIEVVLDAKAKLSEISADINGKTNLNFYTSGYLTGFKEIGAKILGEPINKIEKILLGQ